ncbi:hypothetical protein J6590_001522 [Homalodisca vitripennis]|nr:hypothetical protein J6590_001522 [Homalodisca vitripennis]
MTSDWVQDATYLSLSMTVTGGVVLSHVSVLKRLGARCNLLVPLNDCDCGVVLSHVSVQSDWVQDATYLSLSMTVTVVWSVTCFCTKATGKQPPPKHPTTNMQDATYLSLSMTVTCGVVLSHVLY